MDDPSGPSAAAPEEILSDLEAVSYVAHRDACAALPALQPFGPQAVVRWLETGRDLFFRDRDAGRAYWRGSPAMAAAFAGPDPWLDQVARLGGRRGGAGAAEGFMAQAAGVRREWGPRHERRWFELGSRWLERDADAGARYFATPFQALAGGAGLEGLVALLAPAEGLAAAGEFPLGLYLDAALSLRDSVGLDGLARWAARGAAVLRAARARGEAYFRLESEEGVDSLLELAPGFSVRRHGRFLRLLLAAWFGADCPAVAARGWGESAWRPGAGRAAVATDGWRLWLPALFPDRESAVLGVLHGAGHLAFGSYELPAPAAAWAALSASAGAHGPAARRFPALFDLCEDLRIDARLARSIPGYAARLARHAATAPRPTGPAGWYRDRLCAAVEALAQADPAAALGPRLAPLHRPDATLETSWSVARAWFEDEVRAAGEADADGADLDAFHLPGRGPNAPLRTAAAGAAQTTEAAQSAPDAARVDPAAGVVDAAAARADPEAAGAQRPGAGGRGTGTGGSGVQAPVRVSGPRAGAAARTVGRAYPEWDYREQAYREAWARVRDCTLAERDAAGAERLWSESRALRGRLRRALQRQRPHRAAPLRRQPDGDELDVDAAVAYTVARRAGHAPRPDVYTRRAPRRRDTAVLLLADVSTSIMAHARRGGGRVVERLRTALLVFADALEQVGDPYAIRGFASKYHDGVEYYRIRDFDGRLDAQARAVIAALSGRLASRMGAGIRRAVDELRAVPATRRLLLILSDGRPADYDDGGDARYLHEDTRMAMKEAHDAGVHAFCVTLDSSAGQYLPAIFGPGHYLVLEDVDRLPARLPEIYLRLRH